MKLMRKLSSQLLLALGVIALSVIVWQVIVSKQVIGDAEKIRQVQSIEQIQNLLNNRELKTYHSIPCRPFSKIKLSGIHAQILKGNEYAIYVSDYCKRQIEVGINGDELFIHSLSGLAAGSFNTPVFIFMPEDPRLVYCILSDYGWVSSYHYKIYGFRGEDTLLSCEGAWWVKITTDMPFIHVNQKDNYLNLYTSGLDSTVRNKQVQMNIQAENSRLKVEDRISEHIDVNIQLQESIVEQLIIHPDTRLGTLSLKGSFPEKQDPYNVIQTRIIYPGLCDSLLIQLTNHSGNAGQLFLSKNLSGRFEKIDCSDNIAIARAE